MRIPEWEIPWCENFLAAETVRGLEPRTGRGPTGPASTRYSRSSRRKLNEGATNSKRGVQA